MRRFMTGKWLLTHALVIGVVIVFLWLGRWQLGRGEAGNVRSYAYALEWPTFALLVVGFWVKIMRDDLHPKAGSPVDQPAAGTGGTAHRALDGVDGAVIVDEDEAELAAYNRYVADRVRQRSRQ